MLYYLFDYLNEIDFPGAGMFKYISFRSAMAMILSLFIATAIGRRIIDRLQRLQIGETVRNLGLEGQVKKQGTPTMGGIIIIIAIVLPTILFARMDNVYVLLMLFSTLWLGAIGFMDDYIKVFKKNKEGIPGRYKLFGQCALGIIVATVLFLSPETETLSTQTTIPFFKNNTFDYAYLVSWMGHWEEDAAWGVFALMVVFLVMAVSNGANITDGLDGLAAGNSAIIGVALGILAYMSSHINYASFLNIMYVPKAEELVVFASAFIGATVGFLWYNAYPAQVFMGDTGSLTLGGVIAVFAIIIRKELLIPILCGVFLVENLSVICQVAYFKYTKRKYGSGKRIFKMSPLHHHFQKPGNAGIQALFQKPFNPVPESKIVVRFWLIGIILAVLTIVTLKMR